jgi:hypothetical protein
VTEQGEDQFWTQADAGGLMVLDNADTRTKWLADALAAAATDGSREKRMLYTDSTIVRQRARAWVAVTSANPVFGSDSGLADRLLVVRLDRRIADTAESALSDELAANRDGALSWLCSVLSTALADRGAIPSGLNRRHPDFAAFAVRIGRAMGREAQVIAALQSAEGDKHLFCLENDDLGRLLLESIPGEKFTGTAAELLDRLGRHDSRLADFWTPRKVGKRLDAIWPHIEAQFVARKEKSHGNLTTYYLANG